MLNYYCSQSSIFSFHNFDEHSLFWMRCCHVKTTKDKRQIKNKATGINKNLFTYSFIHNFALILCNRF